MDHGETRISNINIERSTLNSHVDRSIHLLVKWLDTLRARQFAGFFLARANLPRAERLNLHFESNVIDYATEIAMEKDDN